MFIAATGMVCPVGSGAARACAAKRAGISMFAELPYYDRARRPIVGAAMPNFEWTMRTEHRLFELLTDALADLFNARAPTGYTNVQYNNVPLLVCLAEPGRPGGAPHLVPSVVAQVQDKLRIRFHPNYSRVFTSGHTAGFEALRWAKELFDSGVVAACVVCGADSFVNSDTLSWLNLTQRLKRRGNRDGVIPGEAAAAVLVQSRPTDGTATELMGLGFGKEPAPVLSEEPLLGRGLADAARAALAEARLGLHEIDLRLSDVTGELYGFKELALIEGRLMRELRKEEQPVWHWAEAIGDTGAAAGIAQLVLADQAFLKRYAPGERAICLTSSVPGDRAAAVLRNRAQR
jgi:3-oxoacyl-[acyl-carrier-protein] synthase I